jgi:hypothetical protein
LVTLPGCENAPKLHYEFELDEVATWTELFKSFDEIITFINKLIFYTKENPDRRTVHDEARKKLEEMTKLRSDSLIKLRKFIVDVRSGRENNLRYHILENIEGVRQWFLEKKSDFGFFHFDFFFFKRNLNRIRIWNI